ncbi:MAG TPA: hypothetical protein VHD33_01560 [Legionellaceae bacterium]|nr:hypothetical protein [Legionellaceae bacterium]
MSFRTRVEEALVNTPNILTGTIHAGLIFMAYLSAMVPKVGQKGYEALTKAGDQITKDSLAREAVQRKRIVELAAQDNQARIDAAQRKAERAQNEAATATHVAPQLQAAARSQHQKQVIEDQSRADLAMMQENTRAEMSILREKEKGQITQTRMREQQEIHSAQQDTQYAIQEQNAGQRAKLFSQLEIHLSKMSHLNDNISQAAERAQTAATGYENASKISFKAIVGITKAMNQALEAQSNLQKALNNYDQIIAEHELSAEHEKVMQTALLAILETEKKLETLIAMQSMNHQSKLQQAYMADIANKNQSLRGMMQDCKVQTLEKLTELTQREIETEQNHIHQLSDPKDIQQCKNHLDKLSNFKTMIKEIHAEKIKDQQEEVFSHKTNGL